MFGVPRWKKKFEENWDIRLGGEKNYNPISNVNYLATAGAHKRF